MNGKVLTSCWSLMLCLILVLSGCAITRTPLAIDANFAATPPDIITLLPVVDARKDKTAAKIDLDKDLKTRLVKLLARKGYSVLTPEGFIPGEQLVPAASIAEMDVEELAKLGPVDSEHLFILYLDDLATDYTGITKTTKLETSAVLVDKRNSRSLWKDKCVRTSSGGIGLTSGLIPTQTDALDVCIGLMLIGFPDRCHKCKGTDPVVLEVLSQPSGASVEVNGVSKGTTPARVELAVSKQFVGLAVAPGGMAHGGDIFAVTVRPPPHAEQNLVAQTKYIAPALTGAKLFFNLQESGSDSK